MVQWLALSPHSKNNLGFSVWSLHAPCLCGCSGFLPHFKDMQVRLTGDSKFPVRVTVSVGVTMSVNVCLNVSAL